VSPWINRIGLVFDFLAFWLAAPEILGEERLRKAETLIERGFSSILSRFQKIFKRITGRDLPLSLDAFLEQERFTLRMLSSAFWILLMLVVKQLFFPSKPDAIDNFILLQAIINLVMGIAFSGVLIAVAAILAARILRWLYEGEQLRQLLILIGAIIFTMGFIFQFMATF
jgi:hypothetical protein